MPKRQRQSLPSTPEAAPDPAPEAAPPAGRPEVETTATRCPACGSTERERYTRSTSQAFAGIGPDGAPFTHVVRRWTRCAACGQARVDRSLENRLPPEESGGADKKAATA
jgi:hypothetical protein